MTRHERQVTDEPERNRLNSGKAVEGVQVSAADADAEQLAYLTMGIVQRRWNSYVSEVLSNLGLLVPNQTEAKMQLSLAVLAFGLGTSVSDEFFGAIGRVFLDELHEDGADVVDSLRTYHTIRRDWPKLEWASLPCRHKLPPLYHPQELMAIIMAEKAGIDLSFECAGFGRTYNLLHVQMLGTVILSLVDSVNDASRRVPFEAAQKKGLVGWLGRFLRRT